jgi:hypothetical protein
MNSSVCSLDTPQKDCHTPHLLETEILPLFDDKFAQVCSGRITLRGYSQMVIVKLAETSVHIAEPADTDEQEEKLDNPLPKLKFELTETSNVAVDGV